MIFACFPLTQACYVSKLALKQGQLMSSRKLISEVLEDSSTPKRTKKKLNDLKEILSFARDEKLNVQNAYQYYVDMGAQTSVSYIVSAAYSDRLENYMWWFPIVGDVPYKGFFDVNDRNLEAKRLEESGFDVYVSGVGAYSSLGWFEDPIYSPMLRRSKASLANLIFHELIHRTLWFGDHARFNENLATFGADLLTRKFLKLKNYEDLLTQYETKIKDRELFNVWLKELKQALNDLFTSERFKGHQKELLAQKNKLYSEYASDKKPKFTRFDYVGEANWNNARLLASSMYSPNLAIFYQAWDCTKVDSMGEFLQRLDKEVKETQEPYRALEFLCHQ